MGQPVIVGDSNNIFTSTLNTSAKTLTINNVTAFPLDLNSLASVWDSTTSSFFDLTQLTFSSFSWTKVAGIPSYVWTFTTLPAGVANGDTLVIELNIPQNQADYSILQKIASATV